MRTESFSLFDISNKISHSDNRGRGYECEEGAGDGVKNQYADVAFMTKRMNLVLGRSVWKRNDDSLKVIY